MNIDQLNELYGKNLNNIFGESLENKSSRTLIYGYSIDRETIHVYLNNDKKIVKLRYKGHSLVDSEVEGDNGIDAHSLVPSKRAYPEACDFEFCKLMMAAGVSITFTSFDFSRPNHQFHGLVLEDFD